MVSELIKYQKYLNKCATYITNHVLEEYGWVTEIPNLTTTIADTALNAHKLKNLEEGDGTPTLVIPGFTVSNSSTSFMRRTLNDCGHNTLPWIVDVNRGFSQRDIDSTILQVKDIVDQYGKPINIVGQSLGGCYARTVANAIPNHVRNIITLGSPINGIDKIRPLTREKYDRVVGFVDASLIHHKEFVHTFKDNHPEIPTTSIYSTNDGVVHWTLSQIIESDTSENIHVEASHFSMGFSLEVLQILANRLSKHKGNWYKL